MSDMTERIDSQVGDRVRRVRKLRGFSLSDLSAEVGMHLNTLSKLERGDRKVTIGEATAIATALHVPLDLFITNGPLTVTVNL